MKVFVVLGVIVCFASAGCVDSSGWQSGGSSSGWPSSGGGSSGWSSGGSSGPAKIIKVVEENHGHGHGAQGSYHGGHDEEIVKIVRVQGGGHGGHSSAPPMKVIKLIDGSSAGGHGGYSGGHGDSGCGSSDQQPQVIKVIKILGGAPGKNFVPDINNPWLIQGNAHGNPLPQNTNQNGWPSQNVWQ